MKIIYLYDAIAIWGGIERILVNKMNSLVGQADYEVYIITSNHGSHPIPYAMDKRINHIDLNIGLHKKYQFKGLKRYVEGYRLNRQYYRLLEKQLDMIKPDIIVCTSSHSVKSLLAIAKGVPVLVESHANFSRPEKLWHRLATMANNCWIGKTSGVVTLTEGDAANWRRLTGKVHVIPNIVNLNDTGIYSEGREKRVIFVGRFVEQKGIGRLFDVWKMVNERFPDWKLDVYGDGELWQHFCNEAERLDIGISIHKPTDNIFEKYRQASLLLVTSVYEPFGLVMPEAMSCGLPVVAFDCPYGPGEIIRDGENGFLIAEGNTGDFVEKTCLLMANSQLRAKMGKKAIKSVECFSEKNILPLWLDLFEKLNKKNMLFKTNRSIPLVYWNVANFGDILSPYIVSRLSGQQVVHKECYRGMRYVIAETLKRLAGRVKKPLESINYPLQRNMLGVGSIIGWGNGSSVVWGSGFMNFADGYRGEHKVTAVRGRYTDEKLQKMGHPGCGVYGDPALLMPLIYRPEAEKKHKAAIIPHITETDQFAAEYAGKAKVIDLRTFDVESVIDQVCSCEYILSTSLHGIIIAHAYGIPAIWVKKNFINTDGFKFKDYFSSVDIREYAGFEDIEGIMNDIDAFFADNKDIALPHADMDTLRRRLMEAAPFGISEKFLSR